MNNKLDRIKYTAVVIFLIEAIIALIAEFAFYMRFAAFMLICVVLDAIYIFLAISRYETDAAGKEEKLEDLVNEDAAAAITFGQVGLVAFDDDFKINWMSDLFTAQGIDEKGHSITAWIPQLGGLFQDQLDEMTVDYQNHHYLVERGQTGNILYFRDITEDVRLTRERDAHKAVIGLINLDNYAETIQYEDESKIALINSNLRQKVSDWCRENGLLARRIRNDRFIVFTDQQHYDEIFADRFSIMNEVRQEAVKLEVAITLSMGWAYGSDNLLELDEMVNDLLELAQNRGGDQAAIQEVGEDISFIGGNTEASDKRSGVRVRVMSQSIRGLMENSDHIFVVLHSVSDFDCMGSALGISRMALLCGQDPYIVGNGFTLETKLNEAMNRYGEQLNAVHRFITKEQALSMMTDKSLVVVVDHHTVDQCATPEVIQKCRRVLVIDHHRRRKDDNIKATMMYLEASASSAVELVTELLVAIPQKVELLPEEANIMLAGMVVDTNHFRNRSGQRTFEAAAQLRKWGADPLAVDDLLKNSFTEFEIDTTILSFAQRVLDRYVIAAVGSTDTFTRAQLSQAADKLLGVQDIEASFVIGRIAENTVAISARSAGTVNVQVIMEAMHGGGHFGAAALQRNDTTVDQLFTELVDVLKQYDEEEKKEHESNSVE